MNVPQIGDNRIGSESEVGLLILFTGYLPAIHPSKKLTLLWDNSCHDYHTCLEWTKQLEICSRPPGAGWQRSRSFQKNLLLSLTFSMIQDGFPRSFFLPLCYTCLPSTDQGLLLSVSLAPASFSHFHADLPFFHLLTPNHRTSFWKLPTVTLPYHCTCRFPTTTCASCWSLSVPVHLKLSSNQTCTAQLKLRWGTPWEGGMTAWLFPCRS